MGLLANTVSICQFRVVGDLPAQITFEWAQERLNLHRFRSIEQTAEELSLGWVHLDDSRLSDFDAPHHFFRDHYLTFSLRRDQRRIPGALLKAHLQQAENEFLSAHPGLQKVPKAKREELREAVRGSLFARILPTPAVYDAVWDTRRGLLTLASLSPKVGEMFENLFRASFEGLRLVPVHPFARAEGVVGETLAPALQQANRSSSEAVLDLMRDNLWVGEDFLLWLLHRTLDGSAECRIAVDGPTGADEPFIAFLNDRLVMLGGGEEGRQKITVIGPQDRFSEACTALRDGKQIVEATLHMEKGENLWRVTLKGESFHFASLRSPGVKLEKDDLTDEAREKEALFYERMYLLETAQQMFDSLFLHFLRERLADGWSQREGTIREELAA